MQGVTDLVRVELYPVEKPTGLNSGIGEDTRREKMAFVCEYVCTNRDMRILPSPMTTE